VWWNKGVHLTCSEIKSVIRLTRPNYTCGSQFTHVVANLHIKIVLLLVFAPYGCQVSDCHLHKNTLIEYKMYKLKVDWQNFIAMLQCLLIKEFNFGTES